MVEKRYLPFNFNLKKILLFLICFSISSNIKWEPCSLHKNNQDKHCVCNKPIVLVLAYNKLNYSLMKMLTPISIRLHSMKKTQKNRQVKESKFGKKSLTMWLVSSSRSSKLNRRIVQISPNPHLRLSLIEENHQFC